jgi:hypothetical protein
MPSSSEVKRSSNGSLAAAMALLIQNQAAYVSDLRERQKEFALIHRELEDIRTILTRHERLIAGLSNAIADLSEAIAAIPRKIGFKPTSDRRPTDD